MIVLIEGSLLDWNILLYYVSRSFSALLCIICSKETRERETGRREERRRVEVLEIWFVSHLPPFLSFALYLEVSSSS